MNQMDLMLQAEELARRRREQEALMTRGQASGDRARSGKGDILDAIGSWLDKRKADSAAPDLVSAESAYRQRYQQQLGQESSQYLDDMQGRPGDPVPADGVGPMRPEQAANPRQAVINAMTSQLPEMQGLGKAAFSQLGKQEKPEFIQAQDGSVLELPRLSGGTPRVAGKFNKPEAPKDKFGPIEVVGTDAQGRPIQGQRNLTTGKIDPIGNSGQTINIGGPVQQAQKQGFEAWAKEAVGTVKELSGLARSSVKMLSQLNQVEKLSDAGTFSGPTAGTAVWLGQLAKAGGVSISGDTLKRLQNSETFGNTAAELWLQTMNANGGSRGLVKEESERIAANLPALVQTPEGRKQIIAVMRQAAQQNIKDAQESNSQLSRALQSQDPSAFTFGLSSTMLPNTTPNEPAPGSTAGQPPGAMSLDDYLKKLRGGK
jgi:hypothetical protein